MQAFEEPRFTTILGHRIAYVEVGEGDPILFIHGNPTSSYTYREVLGPVAAATGRRCIALDLLGFGRSDKPHIAYSCQLHADIIAGFIENLDLRRCVLVAEDWGGFLGSYAMVHQAERFISAIYMETFLWPMTWAEDTEPGIRAPFRLMRSPVGDLFSRGMNVMINKLIPEHCPISDESLQYYRDSLPSYRARKALGDFPKLLPIDRKPAASYRFAQHLQDKLPEIKFPVLWIKADPGVLVSLRNPCGMQRIEELARVWPQMQVRDFGPGHHFLSEERPERVSEMIATWVEEIVAGSSPIAHARPGAG